MYTCRLKVLGFNLVLIGLMLVTSCNREEKKPTANYPAKPAINYSARTSDSTKKEPETTQQYYSFAYQLATINAGQPVSSSDPNIKRFDNLLTELSSKYVEDKERIANITVKSHGMLKKEGISTSLLEIMEGMNQLVSEKASINKYPEFIAMYHTLRKAGDSHEDAVLNTIALLRSLGVK